MLACAISALTASALPRDAIAIIGRDDVDPSAYVVAANAYPEVGVLVGEVTCVLVDPRWVLTAAHAIESDSPFLLWRVDIGGARYDVEKVVLHPKRVRGAVDSDYDLALVRLARPVDGIAPVALYAKDDEATHDAELVGRGASGDGRGPSTVRDGRLRRATNHVEATFEHSIVFTFDAPPAGTPLEGASGDGDSGGPAFIRTDDTRALAGISSFNSRDAVVYGSVDAYARVSTHREWITATIRDDPASTLARWDTFAASPELPATAAGKAAQRFLGALDTADADTVARYLATEALTGTRSNEDRAKSYVDFIAQHGAMRALGYRTLGERQVAVIARGETSGTYQGFVFEVADDGRLTTFSAGRLDLPLVKAFVPTAQ